MSVRTTPIPKMKINNEILTFEVSKAVNEETNLLATNQKMKHSFWKRKHIEILGRTTNSRLQEKTHNRRIQPELAPTKRRHKKEFCLREILRETDREVEPPPDL
jgi:hypothetical protein